MINNLYILTYIPAEPSHVKPFREMDFVKPGIKLGIEVQFGKYAFMVYNVCAKMTIFRNLGVIDTGIEIVPVKDMVNNKFRIWLVRFGRTASLQIAYVAEPHRTICA